MQALVCYAYFASFTQVVFPFVILSKTVYDEKPTTSTQFLLAMCMLLYITTKCQASCCCMQMLKHCASVKLLKVRLHIQIISGCGFTACSSLQLKNSFCPDVYLISQGK